MIGNLIAGTIDDYKLFEEMNKVTTTKYSDMKQITANVNKALKDLNEKCKSLNYYRMHNSRIKNVLIVVFVSSR